MRSREFCHWLKGFFDLLDPKELTERQVTLTKRHLALVFKYEIDPGHSADQSMQEVLNDIHDGIAPAVGIDPIPSETFPFHPNHPYPPNSSFGATGSGPTIRC